jgi:hypothetical protein
VTVVETVLVFVAIPAAIYGLIALLTMRDPSGKAPRYRPGQAWDYPPVWWTAHPTGASQIASTGAPAAGKPRGTAKGGARGSW